MFVQQTQYTIEKLVSRIRSGRLALPDFQREFVWSPTQVADLLESISREWPIGSLLLLNGPQPFAFRQIDAAPDVLHPELDLYVLDGQQRVTAIYHAIQDVSPYVYYVDFATASEDSDEVIIWERRSRFERKFGRTLEERAASNVALVGDFWDNERFHKWLAHLPESSGRTEFVSLRERRLSGLQSKVYQLLAIELEQGIELEALAKIFETLNKTGVRLNAFDLLVAKLYPTNFNLREEWERVKSEHDLISKFDPDGLEIIKLVALLIRVSQGKTFARGVRQGDVLSLEPRLVSQYWHQAVELYEKSLQAVEQFGVTSSAMVPSWSMILGTAACLISPEPRILKDWWLSRLRQQTFAQAANTRIVADFDALVRGDLIVPSSAEGDFEDMLQLPVRANGLLLRGIFALAIRNGAIDPISGDLLSEVTDPELAEVSPSGNISKIKPTTTFENVLFTTKASLKLAAKSPIDISGSMFGRSAFESQGFGSPNVLRSHYFLDEIFS